MLNLIFLILLFSNIFKTIEIVLIIFMKFTEMVCVFLPTPGSPQTIALINALYSVSFKLLTYLQI